MKTISFFKDYSIYSHICMILFIVFKKGLKGLNSVKNKKSNDFLIRASSKHENVKLSQCLNCKQISREGAILCSA